MWRISTCLSFPTCRKASPSATSSWSMAIRSAHSFQLLVPVPYRSGVRRPAAHYSAPRPRQAVPAVTRCQPAPADDAPPLPDDDESLERATSTLRHAMEHKVRRPDVFDPPGPQHTSAHRTDRDLDSSSAPTPICRFPSGMPYRPQLHLTSWTTSCPVRETTESLLRLNTVGRGLQCTDAPDKITVLNPIVPVTGPTNSARRRPVRG